MKKHLLAMMAGAAMSLTGSYAAAEDITCEFNPANESQLTELSTFEITYSRDVVLDWVDAVQVLRNGEYVTGLTAEIADDKKTVTYTLDKKQTADGTYTFVYLDYSVWPVNEDDALPYIDLTYYIGEPQELEPVVRTNPDQDASLSSLREVLLAFTNVKTLKIDKEKAVTMYYGEEAYPYMLDDVSSPGQPYALAVPVDENLQFTKGGTYKLVIEDGALILNDKPYGYTFTFTVSESLTLVSSDPEAGVTTAAELENITLTFNKEITGITGYMLQGLQLRKLGADDMPVSVAADYDVQIDEADAKIVHLTAIDGVDIDEPGVYSLNLPPTLFVAGKEKNLAMVIDYIIQGEVSLKSLVGESDSVNVYTISGVKVIDNGTRESISTLRPGLYIINGKTTLIKK